MSSSEAAQNKPLSFIKQNSWEPWRTDDPAGLYICDTSKAAEPPQEFPCMVIGHSGIVRPETISVPTADLTFLGAGLFGPPRDKTGRQAGWTGDSYKFGIYAQKSVGERGNIVILRTDGGGFYAYVDVSLTAAEMWRYLCAQCSSPMLWNICSCVVHTHDLAHEKGRKELMHIYAEGRLKKRRRQGQIQVFVEPKILPAVAAQT
jgi:hypothetical protein